MNTVAHIALADFRERVRRFNFLVVVALAVFLGYQVIDGAFQLRLGAYRGILNAAWIGTMMSLTVSFFLSLVGFYVVRGNVQQDRQTGVGQILAATPLSKVAYVTGKFVSNAAVLLIVVGVLALAALAMLLLHGDDRTLAVYHLLMPFLVFSLPVVLLTAAIAVFFECTPVLRESTGNVIYFFFWLVLIIGIGGSLLAFDAVEQSMAVALHAQGTDYRGGIALGPVDSDAMQTFVWTGFEWAPLVRERLIYVGAAVLLVALAAAPFERFDPARAQIRGPGASRVSAQQRITRVAKRFRPASRHVDSSRAVEVTDRTGYSALTPVSASANPLQLFAALVMAEVKLLLKGRPLLWYAVLVGLLLACLLSPLETVRRWLLPLVWLWPVLVWSEMGVRETRHRVDPVLFSAPSPLRRQLPAAWTAGVVLAVVVGSGALLRFIGEPALLPGFVAGALFIPSLALLLGVAGQSERPLQILLLIWWYLGPLNGVTALDITGATDPSLARGIPWLYIAATPVLLSLTLLARRRRLQGSR
jgi:ABC-type transport system involved in multi-copper enzyme maturation permease subunit